jgi:DMSO/TMAO reductase YedYZ molybdopterin-dependent catalytic subunit
LPDDHGFPVRLCVPGWYGCTNIKWVNELVFVDDSAPATAQMIEFALRTHQEGEPALARDFIPATIDQAAMPIRVEKWRVGGEIRYRVDGVLWGGSTPTNALSVQLGDAAWEPVDVCPDVVTNKTWSFWSHEWRAPAAGTYAIRCRIDDPNIRTRRLDVDRYIREVIIDEV